MVHPTIKASFMQKHFPSDGWGVRFPKQTIFGAVDPFFVCVIFFRNHRFFFSQASEHSFAGNANGLSDRLPTRFDNRDTYLCYTDK